MRRRVGVAGLQRKHQHRKKLADVASEIEGDQIEAMQKQLLVFKANLEKFAAKHKKDINKDPVLRKRFHEMCLGIGVDPLASNKGFWAQMLGVGDFYAELGVRILDIAMRTRSTNGGLIEVKNLVHILNSARQTRRDDCSVDDVQRSIKQLQVLGSVKLVQMGAEPRKTLMLQTVPLELNRDHSTVLDLASAGRGFLSAADVSASTQWPTGRALRTLEYLEAQGMAWVDDKHPGGARHWYFAAIVLKQL